MFGSKSQSKLKTVEPVVWLIGFVLLWEFLVKIFNVAVSFIPAPSNVLEKFLHPEIYHHFFSTAYISLIGYAAAIVVGITLGILIAHSEHLDRGLSPLISTFQAVEKAVLAPIFIIWFGFGILPILITTILVVFFPILVNTVVGMKATEPEMLNLLRSFRASKFQILKKARFPRALPYIFTGLKITAPLTVVGAVTSEFFVGQIGLGYLILETRFTSDIPMMFASIVGMAILGIALYVVVIIAEHFLMPWYRMRYR